MLALVDTHLHLIDRKRLDYPWLGLVPQLDQDFGLDAYRLAVGAYEIAAAIHMEVDVRADQALAEAKYAAALGAPVGAVVAACAPGTSGFAAELDALLAVAAVRGVRKTLHNRPDDLSSSRSFIQDVRRIGASGLTFDLTVTARQLPLALALARACPDTTFVLDHCGMPAVRKNELDPWRADMRRIAELPNTCCKISGVIAYLREGAEPVETLRPYVEHCIAVFGWNRVVWGSDWPVCTLRAPLTEWIATTRAIVAGYTGDERDRLFQRNAVRIYRISGT